MICVLTCLITNKRKVQIYILLPTIFLLHILIVFEAKKANPIVVATLDENCVKFKETEIVYLADITELKYYSDVKADYAANGYRWSNHKYFSGDADVIFEDVNGKILDKFRKCKLYILKNDDTYIVIETKGSKDFVFNLGDEDKTEEMYENLQVALQNE